jgi:hypothetical protein
MLFYQPNSVVNYPNSEIPFTRIIEYKHFLHQSSPHTTIAREYPSDIGEPYYPVLTKKNIDLYKKYKEHGERESKTYFLGRLGTYQYLNMDQAIKNSLDFVNTVADVCDSEFLQSTRPFCNRSFAEVSAKEAVGKILSIIKTAAPSQWEEESAERDTRSP